MYCLMYFVTYFVMNFLLIKCRQEVVPGHRAAGLTLERRTKPI
jgi:hypothetical protein